MLKMIISYRLIILLTVTGKLSGRVLFGRVIKKLRPKPKMSKVALGGVKAVSIKCLGLRRCVKIYKEKQWFICLGLRRCVKISKEKQWFICGIYWPGESTWYYW